MFFHGCLGGEGARLRPHGRWVLISLGVPITAARMLETHRAHTIQHPTRKNKRLRKHKCKMRRTEDTRMQSRGNPCSLVARLRGASWFVVSPCWHYLLWSAVDICSDQLLLWASVVISCWDNRSRWAVERFCLDHLFRLSVEISCLNCFKHYLWGFPDVNPSNLVVRSYTLKDLWAYQHIQRTIKTLMNMTAKTYKVCNNIK